MTMTLCKETTSEWRAQERTRSVRRLLRNTAELSECARRRDRKKARAVTQRYGPLNTSSKPGVASQRSWSSSTPRTDRLHLSSWASVVQSIANGGHMSRSGPTAPVLSMHTQDLSSRSHAVCRSRGSWSSLCCVPSTP